jgi:hypothetical protein
MGIFQRLYDNDKMSKYFRDTISKFSNEEKEQAARLACIIEDKDEPTKGYTYEGIANELFGYDCIEVLENEELGNKAIYQVNRVIHVLRCLKLYDAVMNNAPITIFPVACFVKADDSNAIVEIDESIIQLERLVFNGYKDEYCLPELSKSGYIE